MPPAWIIQCFATIFKSVKQNGPYAWGSFGIFRWHVKIRWPIKINNQKQHFDKFKLVFVIDNNLSIISKTGIAEIGKFVWPFHSKIFVCHFMIFDAYFAHRGAVAATLKVILRRCNSLKPWPSHFYFIHQSLNYGVQTILPPYLWNKAMSMCITCHSFFVDLELPF